MKRADEAVEKVLAGLGRVEAGEGFEERIVRRVRGAAREGTAGFPGRWRWVGACCVVLAGVGLSVLRMGSHDGAATNVRSGGGVYGGRKEVGAGEGEAPRRLKLGFAEHRSGTVDALHLSRADFSRRRNVRSSEVVAASESFPAPPLPLTEQERLLLRVARYGEALPVTVLEVAALPSEDVDETLEFQGFFGKPEQVEQMKQKPNQGESR